MQVVAHSVCVSCLEVGPVPTCWAHLSVCRTSVCVEKLLEEGAYRPAHASRARVGMLDQVLCYAKPKPLRALRAEAAGGGGIPDAGRGARGRRAQARARAWKLSGFQVQGLIHPNLS